MFFLLIVTRQNSADARIAEPSVTPNQEKQKQQQTNAEQPSVARLLAIAAAGPQLSTAVKQQVGCHGDAGSANAVGGGGGRRHLFLHQRAVGQCDVPGLV